MVSVAEMPCIPLKERMRSGRCGFLSSHPASTLFRFNWFYFACSNANLERLQVKPPMREWITPIRQRFLILNAGFELRTSPFDHTSKRPSDEEARSFVLGRYNTLALTPEELLIPGSDDRMGFPWSSFFCGQLRPTHLRMQRRRTGT